MTCLGSISAQIRTRLALNLYWRATRKHVAGFFVKVTATRVAVTLR
jgi:hypothetical protein